MSHSPLITAADYADAMYVARRAKNWLFTLLLLTLMAQLTIFFVARYTDHIIPARIEIRPTAPADAPPATQSATTQAGVLDVTPAPRPMVLGNDPAAPPILTRLLRYVVAVTDYAGVVLPVVLASVLLLIVNIMLIGRLVGVARVTSAYIACILLLAMLFPWQSFINQEFFILPGVLYTWADLTDASLGAKFPEELTAFTILRWARFALFPVIALIILLIIQVKSSRGLRIALGEAEVELQEPPAA